jgi:hypothetical protein
MVGAYFSATFPHNCKNLYPSLTSSFTLPHSPENLSRSASYITSLSDLTTSLLRSTTSWDSFSPQRFFTTPELIPLICFFSIKYFLDVTRKTITLPEATGPVPVPCAFSLCLNCFTSSCSSFVNLIAHFHFLTVKAHG